MVEIFKYTERVVNMVRPRRLLFMAIGKPYSTSSSASPHPAASNVDGVAPRAKMNQQRSRRFRSAQEAQQKEEKRQENIKEWEGMLPPLTFFISCMVVFLFFAYSEGYKSDRRGAE